MATVKIYLDARTPRKDGSSPLKLSVAHKGKTALISLGISVQKENWDETNSIIIGLPNRSRLNSILFQKKIEAENTILQLSNTGTLPAMDIRQLKKAISGKEDGSDEKVDQGFAFAFQRFLSQKSNPRSM